MAGDGKIRPSDLPAAALRERLASGSLKAVDLARDCLERVKAEEPGIGAWAWLDPDFVMHQAEALDRYRATGRAIGALHGLPVGLKDIIDTARIPTENGTAIDKGRVPEKDAFVVERLKAAGAVIMGKTVTTELAYMNPAGTRNPHAAEHTPGGSSSGSAAAVAAGMVPLAIGTQTGGSVIRPAAYCGVTGFKPTFGAIPRTGILKQSQTLDTVGVFGRDPRDAALLAEALFGHDPADPVTQPSPRPKLFETASSAPPLPPVLALVKPPGWDDADADTRAAFEELAQALGEEQCFEVPLPAHFADAADLRRRINFAEMARNYYHYAKAGRAQLSETLQEALQEGSATLAKDYLAALDWRDVLYAGLAEIFSHADAILAPAAPGPAPEGLETTGDPIFNGLWTFVGTPTVTVPVFTAGNGLPMGAQLVGARGGDARLLRTATWLYDWLDRPS
ncbi:Putative amidase AmiD [Defluviimonas aquaemixtae]|uniref:Amidase AmiD n=1 Tax=Albidovulum aquaemixtae TaxID=1542388 RepID=A0A2R8BL05_9RHOB|nr:amidase [Defluviimonas aquaemixtae]SPH24033.1 Putative amidase AmiD [Defluviimonas aquaemixtae]